MVVGLVASSGLWAGASAAASSTPPIVNARDDQTYPGMVLQKDYVTTRYGWKVAIGLCFPADTNGVVPQGRFDLVVEFSYTTASGQPTCAGNELQGFVQHGYVAGFIEAPGTGDSEGGPADLSDPKTPNSFSDAGQWLASQPWSSGRIGSIGASGNGSNQLSLATLRPTWLKAMIPQVAAENGYEVYWTGGMRSLSTPLLGCAATNLLSYANNGTNPRDLALMLALKEQQVTETQNPSLGCGLTNQFAQHPNYDQFWQDQRPPMENITIPTWVQGAWDDVTVEGTTELYTGNGAYLPLGGKNNMLAMGWFSHAGSVPGFNTANEALRFFDYWIRGIDTGIRQNLNNGRFRYFNYQEWTPRVAPTYPIPGTTNTPVYLSAGTPSPLAAGSVTFTAPTATQAVSAGYAYDPDQSTHSTSTFLRERNETNPANRNQAGIVSYVDPTGRGDQRLEDPASRVAFLSDPLTQDTTITGRPTMTLYASTTATDTDFVVKLLDIVPDDATTTSPNSPPPGMWRVITVGHLKGTFRGYQGEYRSQTPIPPGQIVRYDVQLDPTGWLIAQGHRIGIEIESADVPYSFPNPNPATVTVYSSALYPSSASLPIVPAGASTCIDTNNNGICDNQER